MDIKERVTEWRAKCAAGTLSFEEMRQGIQYLRENRAAATTRAKKKGTSKKVVNTQDLLGELDAL